MTDFKTKEMAEFDERFGDLAPMIDAATNTGAGKGTTPFSDIYIKDLKSYLLSFEQRVREDENKINPHD